MHVAATALATTFFFQWIRRCFDFLGIWGDIWVNLNYMHGSKHCLNNRVYCILCLSLSYLVQKGNLDDLEGGEQTILVTVLRFRIQNLLLCEDSLSL